MSLDLTVSELRNEIAELRRGLFVGASALLAGLMLWNLALYAPGSLHHPERAQRIFEDMLGSRDKLPDLTKLVLRYGAAANGLLPLAVIVSGAAIAWSLMSLNRKNGRFLWIALVAASFLALHRMVIVLAIEMPIFQIIQGLNSP